MRDYQTYTLDDFLQDDSFRDWVQGKECINQSFWYSFPDNYPDKVTLFRQAERIIRAIGHGNQNISEKEIRSEVDSFLEQISEPKPEVNYESPRNFGGLINWIPWLAAASIVLYFLFYKPSATPSAVETRQASEAVAASNLVRTCNDTDKLLRILLSDSSVVVLSPNSTLRYPSCFMDTSRNVYLSGEATFAVEKGPVPFIVYAGDVVTKVLGTRFVVRAFANDVSTTVQVQTGTVSVFRKEQHSNTAVTNEQAGLIITANQAAIFEKSLSRLTKTLVTDPVKLSHHIDFEAKRYDEIPLYKILNDIEKAYGITIIYNRERFEKCKITATLSDENMYQKLDMLCKSVGARYEIVDGQILIQGKGC